MIGSLVEIVQVIGSLVPVAGIVTLFYKKQSTVSMYLMLTNIGCLIMNSGYWLLMRSETYEEAMMAYKMEYVGNVLFYLFFGLFVISYFSKKFPMWGFYVWASFELIPLFCLFNDKWNFLFAENMSFETHDIFDYHYMQIEPGRLYLIRYCIIAIVLLAGMIASTIILFKTKINSEKNNIARLTGAEFVIVLALSLSLVGGFTYDIVPIFASLAILAIILSVIRGEFFGITEMGREWAFEQMENAVIIVDSMYGFLDANNHAKSIFPELEEQVEKVAIPDSIYQFFLKQEDVQEIDGRYYEKRKMEIRQNDKLEGYSLLLADITKQRLLMEELKEEKNRADEANQAKSAFMSNMSHEIRTPMNAIVGMTEILLRSDLPEEEKEYLGNIQRSGNALLAIINDILDFSKIESGKMEIVEDTYEPMAMLSDLKMIFLNRIGNKEIELIYDIDENLPAKLYGDELRLRQVIINLANNAIKFTEKGHVKLSVKIKKTEGEKMDLRFSVEDTGQGITKEDLGKLFGSFQQVDKKKNHYKEGTGLGLAISKQLVEMMDGHIDVRSEYGKGSEFYFTVSQKVVDFRKASEVEIKTVSQSENILNFIAPEAKIIVVDDNELNRKVALGLLSPLQMQMDTAENGKQALEKIADKRYDMIFMDHMMPIMDGIEATKALRQMEDDYFKNVPVIALTANAIVEARAQFAEAGMNDFVAKPIDIKDICAKIRQYLPVQYIVEMEKGVDMAEESIAGEELAEIEGLDIREGIKNSGTKELFYSLLGDFYKLIDMKSVKMEKCLADGMIRDYTIEVHALKNTARMIGAMELSQWCYKLEQCGNAQEVETLEAETPGMLALYRSYKEVLKPYARLQTGEKQQVSNHELIGKLKELQNAMDNFDLDGVDEAMKQLEKYQFDGDCEPLLDELRAYVADVAMEEVMVTAGKLIDYIEKQQEEA